MVDDAEWELIWSFQDSYSPLFFGIGNKQPSMNEGGCLLWYCDSFHFIRILFSLKTSWKSTWGVLEMVDLQNARGSICFHTKNSLIFMTWMTWGWPYSLGHLYLNWSTCSFFGYTLSIQIFIWNGRKILCNCGAWPVLTTKSSGVQPVCFPVQPVCWESGCGNKIKS